MFCLVHLKNEDLLDFVNHESRYFNDLGPTWYKSAPSVQPCPPWAQRWLALIRIPLPLTIRCWSQIPSVLQSRAASCEPRTSGRQQQLSVRRPPPPLPAPPIHQTGHDTRIAAPLMSRQSETQSELQSTVGTTLPTHVHRSTLRAPNLQN